MQPRERTRTHTLSLSLSLSLSHTQTLIFTTSSSLLPFSSKAFHRHISLSLSLSLSLRSAYCISFLTPAPPCRQYTCILRRVHLPPSPMSLSLFSDSRKRRRCSADAFCADHFNNGLHSSDNLICSETFHLQGCEVCGWMPSANLCASQVKTSVDLGHASHKKSHASSPLSCIADNEDSADSSTGSSCCSSLPSRESSITEQQRLYCLSGTAEDEAESWSWCGGDGASEVDIASFFHDDELCDDASNESLSFNPETIFVSDAGFNVDNCSSCEDARLVGCSVEHGSWFLNDLDNNSQAFLNEVLDQEWMAAAVANLEKLNDTLRADSCVLHLLESDHSCKEF
ncbi:hypothetical protein GOP47_0026080 [Adiantum capillus-veneris]|uniref:Uncharacterized protein n=1 Tax=Adiantum capillus-veneris TaxID=13818 RepID=A0A9D4U402_ADICA|nr:hypothetical protein GOP47_0026080 [Adiantum capillus-veneris]